MDYLLPILNACIYSKVCGPGTAPGAISVTLANLGIVFVGGFPAARIPSSTKVHAVIARTSGSWFAIAILKAYTIARWIGWLIAMCSIWLLGRCGVITNRDCCNIRLFGRSPWRGTSGGSCCSVICTTKRFAVTWRTASSSRVLPSAEPRLEQDG